jgi:RNA polymerase sigma-70 factor (sigma-E family)
MIVYADHQAPRNAPPLDAAFERFVVRASHALLRTALLLSGDRGHAEDLLQMTLLRVHRRWCAIRESPDAYAHEVLVNLSRDRWRGMSRRPVEVQQSDARPELVADGIERLLERDTMAAAVRRLPRRQREVIALRFILDLSVAETATVLGTSEGTVKAYTARALARMRKLLAADDTARGNVMGLGCRGRAPTSMTRSSAAKADIHSTHSTCLQASLETSPRPGRFAGLSCDAPARRRSECSSKCHRPTVAAGATDWPGNIFGANDGSARGLTDQNTCPETCPQLSNSDLR